MSSVIRMLFISQFFNCGVIILMINMKMEKGSYNLLWGWFSGKFTDYSPQWYNIVGMQIYIMYFIMILVPYLLLLLEFLLSKVALLIDTGFTGDYRKTKSANIHDFLEKYTGTDFYEELGLLYATDWNTLFLAMFYGIGMPILFPMCILNLLSQHLVQKIRLAYFCRQPPFLNDELSNTAISILKWCPLFMLFNAYWMLGNCQIFGNKWSYILNTMMEMDS